MRQAVLDTAKLAAFKTAVEREFLSDVFCDSSDGLMPPRA